MRNPLPPRSGSSFNNNWNGGGSTNIVKGFKAQNLKKKSDYCWSFNKGQKCKFGNKCKFIERCSYCDSKTHGVYACPKFDKNGKDSLAKNNMDKRGESGQ